MNVQKALRTGTCGSLYSSANSQFQPKAANQSSRHKMRHFKNGKTGQRRWRGNRLLAAALCLQLFWPGRGLALDPARDILQYNCQTWSHQSGLPANAIYAICQSKDGFLWLGTKQGMVRFDGVEFSVLRLPDNRLFRYQAISSLCSSRDGGIWFGIQNGAFGHYSRKAGFTTLPENPYLDPGMDVRTLLEARDGSLWVGSGLQPATVFAGDTNLTKHFDDEQVCITIYEDSHNRIWLGTVGQKFNYWDGSRLVPFPDSSITNNFVFAVAEDALGQIWLGTQSGLLCYDASLRRMEIPTLDGKITALLLDRHGALWIGTVRRGLWRFKDGQYSNLTKQDGLADNTVTALCEDREGSLWVGTQDGLSQLSDVRFPLYSKEQGLADGSFHAVCASAKGGLWAGSTAGLTYYDGHQASNYSTEAGLSNLWVKTPFEARNGDVYFINGEREILILSGGNVAARMNYQNQWPTAFTEDAEGVLVSVGDTLLRISRNGLQPYRFQSDEEPQFNWIRNLGICRDDTILVATVNGLFRVKNGEFKRLGMTNGLPVSEVLWASEDEDGTIWAGLAGGLARIKGDRVDAFTQQQGLFDDYISAIVPDNHGWLWMHSPQGIYRVSRSSVSDVADHRSSRLQCVSYEGLESVKTTETADIEPTACRTTDGRIWFPAPQGLIMVDPDHLPDYTNSPFVHIQRVRINGVERPCQPQVSAPQGRGELEVEFTAATFIKPRKVQFRYKLEGYEPNWIEAGARRSAFFANLKPGSYRFSVQARNDDGSWSADSDSLALRLEPHYYQTAWFDALLGGLGCAALLGLYARRMQKRRQKERSLLKARELLEAEVLSRTAELAKANSSLQQEVAGHKQTAAELKKKTQSLEREIEERKRMQLEVERAQRELLDASRLAGMSEIATNVLHNVGNVLNSVNISASLATERVKNARTANLAKVTDLLLEHQHDMAAFISSDPKGRQVLSYLAKLSAQLQADQASAVQELDSLRKNVEHINEIVATQQNYANVSGVKEIVNIHSLIEDSLRMNQGTFTRHKVEVIRDFADVPPVNVDRHKILQILINLLRNAKHACDESGRADKRMVVRVARDDARLKISVVDNGVGIPPENLNRIFNHGFTTRRNGHGFGLHSGALAAREMGGSLTVHSEGPGKGAAFTLELPLPSMEERS
jgi:ligand-binding sensor domain-containing protein/signal transduction histidine kinase